MLWLEIGIVEIDCCILEVLCMLNEVLKIGGIEYFGVCFHAGFGTNESSVNIKS